MPEQTSQHKSGSDLRFKSGSTSAAQDAHLLAEACKTTRLCVKFMPPHPSCQIMLMGCQSCNFYSFGKDQSGRSQRSEIACVKRRICMLKIRSHIKGQILCFKLASC